MRTIIGGGFAAVVLFVAGCAGDGSSSTPAALVKRVSAGDLTPADLTQRPSGPLVLTIAGRIGQHNDGARLTLDLATIERAPLVDLTVYEPFEKRDITFRGVWLDELLDLAAADASMSMVRLHALDDYEVVLTAEQVRAGGLLLATMADGKAMTVRKSGPTRLVFRDTNKAGRNKDHWIWSLDLITIE